MPLTVEEYKSLLTDIIAKQIVILGPDVAILKARSVANITVSDEGTVIEVDGDGDVAVRSLVDSYVKLSGQIVENTLQSVFQKYPTAGQVVT